MVCGNFAVSFIYIPSPGPNFFLGRSHQMSLQLCVVVVVLEACLFNTQSHLTLTALHGNFFVTPLDFTPDNSVASLTG